MNFKHIKKNISYYFWASYRRKMLDNLQEKYRDLYRGVVLDIGGRDRGKFRKPKNKVEKWIFADINKKHNPDILLDVANMKQIKNNSIDVVNAIELFEHVEKIEQGLKECYRVLKKNGTMILSVPFLYPIHADPYDFQRWTKRKWKLELKKVGFKIQKIEIMGRFFTVSMEYQKLFIKSFPKKISKFLKLINYPLMDLITKLDNFKLVRNNQILSGFHGGYFIIAQK